VPASGAEVSAADVGASASEAAIEYMRIRCTGIWGSGLGIDLCCLVGSITFGITFLFSTFFILFWLGIFNEGVDVSVVDEAMREFLALPNQLRIF
jgi:hypothetical protein